MTLKINPDFFSSRSMAVIVVGDTRLTFESGFYDEILSAIRKKHNSCWIVSVSFIDFFFFPKIDIFPLP